MTRAVERQVEMTDLRAFPRDVARVIVDAARDHGVQVRVLDGSHVRLYNGNRDILPLKVSAQRPAELSLKFLLPWLTDNVPSWADADVSAADVRTLAAVVNTRPVKRTDPAPAMAVHSAATRAAERKDDHVPAVDVATAEDMHARQQATFLAEAARALAEHHGVLPDVTALEREIAELRAERDDAVRELGELKARLEIMREALKL